MRIYDHVIRIPYPQSDTGDLRRTGSGLFGMVCAVHQLFLRPGADVLVTNATVDAQNAAVTRRASNFEVFLWFEATTGFRDAPSSLQMEDACLEHMHVIAGPARERVATRFICGGSGRVIDRPGISSVLIPLGMLPDVLIKIGRPAIEHLNGLVRGEPGEWVPGHPHMSRIVRVACELDEVV